MTCKHFQLPIADPGPCYACERERTSQGPVVSFPGGRNNWRDGKTVGETMREWKADWKADGIEAEPRSGGRWI